MRERGATAPISALRDSQGQRVTDLEGLERQIVAYYQNLYAAVDPSPEHEGSSARILDGIQPTFRSRFSAEDLEALGDPPTAQELHKAIKAMASGKSPGPDGVVVEFYKHFWGLIGNDFTQMVATAITNQKLPSDVNSGLIVLLPKDSDLEMLKNWQPITLLNTAYKVIAKALQSRLQKFLIEVIHDSQSAFLPQRYILDSVMVMHEMVDWAKASEQPLAILKLDFTKPYDSVNWEFLFQVMSRMGLPVGFTCMVKMLLEDAKAAVSINGACSGSFAICRGVRQGCPLAPYLYIIVAEALSTAARYEVR